jgi:hypothetical protein
MSLSIRIICLISSLALASCGTSEKKDMVKKIRTEVNNLKTIEKKKDYLINIKDSDQAARTLVKRAEQHFGNNSPEHELARQKMIILDSLNFQRIELYFVKYGYPTIENEGQVAAYIPLFITHHITNAEQFTRVFDTLRSAYKEGDLQASEFCRLLDKMYYFKFGKQWVMEKTYSSEDRIELLIDKLQL